MTAAERVKRPCKSIHEHAKYRNVRLFKPTLGRFCRWRPTADAILRIAVSFTHALDRRAAFRPQCVHHSAPAKPLPHEAEAAYENAAETLPHPISSFRCFSRNDQVPEVDSHQPGGHSLKAKPLPSKQMMRVRFPLPAPLFPYSPCLFPRTPPRLQTSRIGSSMAEQGAHNSLVTGSNPVRSTTQQYCNAETPRRRGTQRTASARSAICKRTNVKATDSMS